MEEGMVTGFSGVMGSVMEGVHAPLAIVLTAIVTVFGIYMKSCSNTATVASDDSEEIED